MDIKTELKNFYNKSAKKYHETRNKYWNEFDVLINEIDLNSKKKISILEFGCGS
jgi:hypothetical protein